MSMHRHILYSFIRTRCQNEEILWPVHTLIFHDPTKDYHLKSSKTLLRRIPCQKSLFKTEQDRGLPIGNLTSQFFANVYLNGLDQFVKQTFCMFELVSGRALDSYFALALRNGHPVVVINQTGYMLPHVAERVITVKYLPMTHGQRK